jgi:carboxylesterase
MLYNSAFDDEIKVPYEKLTDHAKPFWLKNQKKSDAIVICCHGFTASTYESRPVGEEVYKRGIDAAGIVVPAHGLKDEKEAMKAMGSVKKEEWMDSIRSEIKKASELYDHVYIYGQSMGGILSLIMAEEHLVELCACTAPALQLPKGAGLSAVLMGWANINVKFTKKPGPFFNDAYGFDNARAGKQLQHMALLARKNLEKITCPVFIAHSHNDRTINHIVTDWIKSRVSGPVQIQWFDKSDHTMPLDVQATEVCSAVADFFETENKKLL